MTYHITSQIAPLPKPGTRRSHVNRAFNAALGEFLALENGKAYAQLYENYMNTVPRFAPKGGDCDRWSDVDVRDAALQRVLTTGALRFGYTIGAPYVYWENAHRTGFDYDLATELTKILSRHFFGADDRLTATWTEVTLTGGDQADKLTDLYNGLASDDYDLALAGQMILPTAYLGGLPIEWTAPTAILFTNISYTGRDSNLLDVENLKTLLSTDLANFQAYAIEESQRTGLELRVFTVVNPGPSPKAGQDLVYAINHGKGNAVWHCGDVPDSDNVMYNAIDHFAVGDSLASGAQTKDPRFKGIYLNLPATNELWPIAGFTAGVVTPVKAEVAVYAEHSDTMKPMTLDASLPAQMQGWNVRVFNRVEVQSGNSIQLQNGTGVVTLGPGLHHITAISIVTYDGLASPGRVSTDAEPFAGYCRLRYADKPGCPNEEAIAVGTMSTANMDASTIDTWLEVEESAQLVLEHQVGNDLANLYLQGNWQQSSWHVFARISIQRL